MVEEEEGTNTRRASMLRTAVVVVEEGRTRASPHNVGVTFTSADSKRDVCRTLRPTASSAVPHYNTTRRRC